MPCLAALISILVRFLLSQPLGLSLLKLRPLTYQTSLLSISSMRKVVTVVFRIRIMFWFDCCMVCIRLLFQVLCETWLLTSSIPLHYPAILDPISVLEKFLSCFGGKRYVRMFVSLYLVVRFVNSTRCRRRRLWGCCSLYLHQLALLSRLRWT
jgi:hypothetical protein